MANIEILQCEARGGSSDITVATGIKAREPKTCILLVVRQTIGLLCHVTQYSNDLAVLTNIVD